MHDRRPPRVRVRWPDPDPGAAAALGPAAAHRLDARRAPHRQARRPLPRPASTCPATSPSTRSPSSPRTCRSAARRPAPASPRSALSDSWDRFGPAIEDWRRLSVYYAAITSEGRGTVHAVPGLRDPLVTYRLTRRDRALLGRGLARLALVMLEAGATAVYPSFRGAPVVRRRVRPGGDAGPLRDLAGERDDGAPVLDRALRRGTPLGRRQLRARARHEQRPGQRRLAAADRARRQPAGLGDGRSPSATPAGSSRRRSRAG